MNAPDANVHQSVIWICTFYNKGGDSVCVMLREKDMETAAELSHYAIQSDLDASRFPDLTLVEIREVDLSHPLVFTHHHTEQWSIVDYLMSSAATSTGELE